MILLFGVTALVATACGGEALTTPTAPPQASPTPTTAPTPTTVAIVDEGHQLFIAKGCSACHGQDAQGTAIAPAMPGHSAAIVKRQARAPVGVMPLFPPDKITNEELDLIAQFIASLPAGHQHMRQVDVGSEVALHHWMALLSLEEGEITEGIHHVEHIIGLVQDTHLARMQEILQQLQEGEVHDATHGIQDMLAGTAEQDLSVGEMHLQMALSGLRVEDVEGASHHLGHFLEVATEDQVQQAQAILDAIHGLEFENAEHEIEELLGIDEDHGGEDHADDD
ncbi:MAG: cytochrome c [Dehalococcoidia bacterium]